MYIFHEIINNNMSFGIKKQTKNIVMINMVVVLFLYCFHESVPYYAMYNYTTTPVTRPYSHGVQSS